MKRGKKGIAAALAAGMLLLGGCSTGPDFVPEMTEAYESVEGRQIKMNTDTAEVVITLGRAEEGAEKLRDASGTVRLELITEDTSDGYPFFSSSAQ